MRIFITGGTGFIGSAVVDELVRTGHEVVGLARSEKSARVLEGLGAKTFMGSLEDIDSIRRGTDSADAVMHLAFVHDFADFNASVEIDRKAIEAIGETLSRTNKAFVVTSGVPMRKDGELVTEETPSDTKDFPRMSETAALPFVEKGVRVLVVRPSRFVHGEGDAHGFTVSLINTARQTGKSAYIGDGKNRVQAVHRLDVASLFRLALEKGTAGGIYQAVGDGAIPFRKVAEMIARMLNVPAVSIPPAEATAHFGFLGQVAGADNPASSEATQKALGWKPTHPTLLEDLASGFYFA